MGEFVEFGKMNVCRADFLRNGGIVVRNGVRYCIFLTVKCDFLVLDKCHLFGHLWHANCGESRIFAVLHEALEAKSGTSEGCVFQKEKCNVTQVRIRRSGGRAVRQRSAKPCTAVRIRSRPRNRRLHRIAMGLLLFRISGRIRFNLGLNTNRCEAPAFSKWLLVKSLRDQHS